MTRIPKVGQDFNDKLGWEFENYDPYRGAISRMKGWKPEYSLALVCTHLGFTPCVQGVTARPASLSFGAIVVTCGVRKTEVRREKSN